jgi:hypothetical protein
VRQCYGRLETVETIEQGFINQVADKRRSQNQDEQAESATCAIGDLHGEVTLRRQLLDRLAPHLDDTLIFLGAVSIAARTR